MENKYWNALLRYSSAHRIFQKACEQYARETEQHLFASAKTADRYDQTGDRVAHCLRHVFIEGRALGFTNEKIWNDVRTAEN